MTVRNSSQNNNWHGSIQATLFTLVEKKGEWILTHHLFLFCPLVLSSFSPANTECLETGVCVYAVYDLTSVRISKYPRYENIVCSCELCSRAEGGDLRSCIFNPQNLCYVHKKMTANALNLKLYQAHHHFIMRCLPDWVSIFRTPLCHFIFTFLYEKQD